MNSLKLDPIRLALGGAALALAACAAGDANSASAATASGPCAISAGASGATPRAAPTILPSPPNNAIRMDRLYTLTGDCADEAQAFEMDHILFADGRVMAIGDGGSLSLVDRRPAPVEPSVLSPQQGPRLDGAALAFAARMNYRREGAQLASTYVGVWRIGSRSVVATFRMTEGGQATTPRRLLESARPIVGLGYFPSPDSPSGQLGVAQRVSAGTTRLLNYQWYHPGL